MGRIGLKIGVHVRYADDILVMCRNYGDAVKFKRSVTYAHFQKNREGKLGAKKGVQSFFLKKFLKNLQKKAVNRFSIANIL